MVLGDTLIIGKNDDGKIVSVKSVKKLLEDLPNKITSVLGIIAAVNLHETEQDDFIEIVVEPHPNPVNCKGEYHYRSGSTKQELKGATLDKFLLQKYGKKCFVCICLIINNLTRIYLTAMAESYTLNVADNQINYNKNRKNYFIEFGNCY